ncbi:uncharacterized protein M421DRAFT_251547 [Didymella exigua CBS 183.55]|uniref:Uncharacterized protein n=1 Tax=Didymella exigua CBS 183.55 TaxID=1150837 RepID=A0A6A5S323_9PLEO|nr:uncharacterized protein M421DRAFT_251547 [Didymella exigua CBS 183.55]KAF1932876.1 hypothetical protein M421DRAFT_251547 [Didymella exigua CBS 183.55]
MRYRVQHSRLGAVLRLAGQRARVASSAKLAMSRAARCCGWIAQRGTRQIGMRDISRGAGRRCRRRAARAAPRGLERLTGASECRASGWASEGGAAWARRDRSGRLGGERESRRGARPLRMDERGDAAMVGGAGCGAAGPRARAGVSGIERTRRGGCR